MCFALSTFADTAPAYTWLLDCCQLIRETGENYKWINRQRRLSDSQSQEIKAKLFHLQLDTPLGRELKSDFQMCQLMPIQLNKCGSRPTKVTRERSIIVYAELYECFKVCKANVTRPIKRRKHTEGMRQKGTTKCKWQAHLAYKKVNNKWKWTNCISRTHKK